MRIATNDPKITERWDELVADIKKKSSGGQQRALGRYNCIQNSAAYVKKKARLAILTNGT